MKRFILGLVLSLCALPASGFERYDLVPNSILIGADEQYILTGIGRAEHTLDSIQAREADYTTLTLGYGFRLFPHFALEARVGTSTRENVYVDRLQTGADARLNWFASAFGRVDLLTGKLRPYLLVGYTHAEIGVDVPGLPDHDDSAGDLSYGGGIGYDIGGMRFAGECLVLYEDDGSAFEEDVTMLQLVARRSF